MYIRRIFFLQLKKPERKTYRLSSYGAKVNKEWMFNSTSPYAFVLYEGFFTVSLGPVKKLQKATVSFFMSVRPSLRMN